MKSTTTARMPETTLIRVTLSISSPQRGLAPLALQFPSTTFVDWLLDSVWLSCCLQVVHFIFHPATGMFRTQNKTLIEVHGRSQGKSCIGLHSLAIAPLKFSR